MMLRINPPCAHGRANANAAKAKQNETEIITTARELGLNPTPAGTGPNHWHARCPQTKHNLYITASTNQFGCGWCKRKGGPDALRGFVAQRKARASNR